MDKNIKRKRILDGEGYQGQRGKLDARKMSDKGHCMGKG
jgi:hypothetical protein